jgi:hypothetical protein
MHQNEEGKKRKPLRDSKRKKGRWRSGSAAARSSGSGVLGGGGVERERGSIEWCGVERSSGAAFYRWRGKQRGRG